MSAPKLEADALLAAAQNETGLADYGDDASFRTRFGLAVDHINSIGMDEAGQRAAAAACHWLLVSRLQLVGDRERYPIADEQIVRPLFATGQPRSGTTLLHALMSVDPNARSLRFWETMYPSPPPGLSDGGDDQRRGRADADWREINAKIPKWLLSHPYNDMLGDGLPEDERTWALDFRVMTPTAWWRVPMGMKIGGLPLDPRAQYAIHKMMLQQFQYARPGKYWVLKGFHGARLEALFETYPDASLIWTHRDPVQVIASRIMMAAELVEGMIGHVDLQQQAAIQLADARASMAAMMQAPMLGDPRIQHVRYTDFTADPVGTIRRFYEHSGVAWTAEAEAAMRHYLANNRGDRYGKFTYSPDVIGVDIEQLHREFAPFRKRFGIEIEQRK
ncbi:sulfotransferase family protein [Hydrocarboniphaga sp.]|uniref:sulfotransferase family protein n=1 Tax=Hydrocarboniphaga sp. TaxID=2033016 RepID=UPI003D13DC1A